MTDKAGFYIYEIKYPDFNGDSPVYVHMDDGTKFKMLASELVYLLHAPQAKELIISLWTEGKCRIETGNGQWADVTVKPRLH